MQGFEGKRILSAVLGVLMLPLAVYTTAYAASDEDDTPPVLYSVAVNQPSVYPGGTIVVSADADDDDSGVQSIKVQFQNAASGDTLTANLLLNSDEDIDLPYSGVLKVPADTPVGTYQVVSVTVKDWEDNQARYTRSGQQPLMDGMLAEFSVSNPASVSQSSPASCQAMADSSGVFIRFSATGSEIDQVTLLFENAANHHKLTFTLEQEDYQDGIYANRFDIPAYEPSGTFTLKKVTIKDASGTKTTYTTRDDDDKLPLTITASFVLQSAHNDLQAPVLHSVSIGQPVWDEGEAKALLTVQATDNLSGIDHITVKFVHVTTGDKASKVLRASDSGDGQTFAGYLKLDENDARGTYRLDSVTVVDRAGNRNTYCHPDDVNDRKLPLPQIPTFQLV